MFSDLDSMVEALTKEFELMFLNIDGGCDCDSIEEITQKVQLIADQLADDHVSLEAKQEALIKLCNLLIVHGGTSLKALLKVSSTWEQCFISGLTNASCQELYKAYCIAISFFALHLGRDFTSTAIQLLPLMISHDSSKYVPITRATCLFVVQHVQSARLMNFLPPLLNERQSTCLAVLEMAEVIVSMWPRNILNLGIVEFHNKLAKYKQSRSKDVRAAATRVTDEIKDKFPQIVDDKFVNEKMRPKRTLKSVATKTDLSKNVIKHIPRLIDDYTDPKFHVVKLNQQNPVRINVQGSKIPVLKRRLQPVINRIDVAE